MTEEAQLFVDATGQADEDKPLSPSQIATYSPLFGGCNRKWAWDKIEGIKEPPHPSAEKGTAVHDILEQWLRNGTPIPDTEEGLIAMSGIPYLPAPGPHLELEQWIQLRSDVSKYHGKVDLSYVDDDGIRIVHDHKTTSDFGWAKTGEELLTDPQGVIYAAEAMSRHGVDVIRLRWLYMRTKGAKKALPVVQLTTRLQVESGMETMDGIAVEMHNHRRTGKRALDLEPNPEACNAYGGCPHRQRCNLTVSDLRAATMRQIERTNEAHEKGKIKMGLLDGLKAKAATTPATPPADAPVTTRPAPAINPPAAPAAAKAATPQVIQVVLTPRDLRDEMVLAILAGGSVEAYGDAYALADKLLKKREGK